MPDVNNAAVVQNAYGNFKTGNLDALLAQMDPAIDWTLPTIPNVRISGPRRGRDSVKQFFQMLVEDQDTLLFEPREFVSGDDTVVAIGKYRWRVKSTGKEWGGDFAHVFTIRDGLVVQFREFLDSAAAAEGYRS